MRILAVHLVQQTGQRLVGGRCSGLLAENNTFDIDFFHQSGNSALSNIKVLPAHLMPDFAHTIDLQAPRKDPFNLGLELLITFGAIR